MIKSYHTLLFDADGTLFNYEVAERNALLRTFAHFAVRGDETDLIGGYRLINHELWRKFESGIISLPELRARRFALLFDSIELPLDPHQFGQKYVQHLGEETEMLPGALELLKSLYGHYRLALITNGLSEVQHRRLASSGLDQFFPVVVISEEIGYPKPDPRFFEITLQRMQNPPKENILIIGDSLSSDIAGGNLSGIDTCWYNPEQQPNDSKYTPTYTISSLAELPALLNP